jgi:catechol 2,3-dioxygenase-like lactoylglutathione lyase family enzyme
MELHRGRMIDHVHLVVADLAASQRFYAAIFEALGIPPGSKSDTHFQFDELWVSTTALSATHERTGRIHLAFAARAQDTVDKFHAAALTAGGKDLGQPGVREYHPGYYAAFAADPDGNNIEVVYHGEATYSAASVKITW